MSGSLISLSPFPPPPAAPDNHPLLPGATSLTILGATDEWNRAALVLPWLAYLTEHNALARPCCSTCQDGLPFTGGTTLPWVCIPHFLSLSIRQWTLLLPLHLGYCESCRGAHGMRVSLQDQVSFYVCLPPWIVKAFNLWTSLGGLPVVSGEGDEVGIGAASLHQACAMPFGSSPAFTPQLPFCRT